MAAGSLYYNEEYAAIQDDYRQAEVRNAMIRDANTSQGTNSSGPTRKVRRKEKRTSRYDSNNYALPNLPESSTDERSQGTSQHGNNQHSTTRQNNHMEGFLTWKNVAIVSILVGGLLLALGFFVGFVVGSKGSEDLITIEINRGEKFHIAHSHNSKFAFCSVKTPFGGNTPDLLADKLHGKNDVLSVDAGRVTLAVSENMCYITVTHARIKDNGP